MKKTRQVLKISLLLYLVALYLFSFIPSVNSPATVYAVYFSYYENGEWSDIYLVDAAVDVANATRDTHNRKVVYDYFKAEEYKQWQVFYWDQSLNGIMHEASFDDGETWIARSRLWSVSTHTRYGGDLDVDLINYTYFSHDDAKPVSDPIQILGTYIGSVGSGTPVHWKPMTINNDGSITKEGSANTASSWSIGGSCILAFNNRSYNVYNRDDDGISIRRDPSAYGDWDTSHGRTPDISTSTGGVQLLRYRSAAPFNLISLAKNSTNHLAWNLYNLTTINGAWEYNHGDAAQYLDQLANGYSSFCAASEVHFLGDPEQLHLLYVDASGQLVYRNCSDSMVWSSAEVLVSSGATYPNINVDSAGNLTVLYVSGNRVRYMTRISGAWSSQGTFGTTFIDRSTYRNPAYISSNHYAHDGKVGVIFTAEYIAPPARWSSIAQPYAYAAISLMSISLTIGVGAGLLIAFDTQEVAVLIPLILTGVAISIVLFIALPILNAFSGF